MGAGSVVSLVKPAIAASRKVLTKAAPKAKAAAQGASQNGNVANAATSANSAATAASRTSRLERASNGLSIASAGRDLYRGFRPEGTGGESPRTLQLERESVVDGDIGGIPRRRRQNSLEQYDLGVPHAMPDQEENPHERLDPLDLAGARPKASMMEKYGNIANMAMMLPMVFPGLMPGGGSPKPDGSDQGGQKGKNQHPLEAPPPWQPEIN